jgi:hypothetical protein
VEEKENFLFVFFSIFAMRKFSMNHSSSSSPSPSCLPLYAKRKAEEASEMYFYNKINIGTDNEYKVPARAPSSLFGAFSSRRCARPSGFFTFSIEFDMMIHSRTDERKQKKYSRGTKFYSRAAVMHFAFGHTQYCIG